MINTQDARGQPAAGKLLNSAIKDNKSVKSLVSGISVSIRTGTAQNIGAKSNF